MTWPAGIAIALGVLAALLITLHQHNENRSTTEAAHPQDGETP